jgi:cellulose synthase/poly-beta-1,6-N-acetylglucosamine synthase-like glycosyltransferase
MRTADRARSHDVPFLGRVLQQNGSLPPGGLAQALVAQLRLGVRLGEIVRSDFGVDEHAILEGMAQQYGTRVVSLSADPPDTALAHGLSAETCLSTGRIPWRRIAGRIVTATSRPDLIDTRYVQPFVIVSDGDLQAAVAHQFGTTLSNKANLRCPDALSCRSWARPVGRGWLVLIGAFVALGAVAFPALALWVVVLWAMLNLVSVSALRLVALLMQTGLLRRAKVPPTRQTDPRLPVVSVLVPLYKEQAIVPALIRRLQGTDYPKALLDICLVVEANDMITREALQKIDLPVWMRAILVPPSEVQTKPRAMNYALDFCRGSIIGIYDAEDAPEADQIRRVVQTLQAAPPDIACVQGYLDFYNPRRNWLSRCFTIEYAMWFRVVLHGVERLGLPVLLGGTTVFFRRHVLEELGGWDAHNVTEDADLGFRLARKGYRCGFLDTVTREEANNRMVPWIKQRSRWLKGYAMTWITHMRNPVALWRDLGPSGFLAFQVLLLGTLSNFLLAPVVGSFWLIAFGVELPLMHLIPDTVWMLVGRAYVASEVLSFVVGVFAVHRREHRHLLPFVATMPFYWPLGSIAILKALYEVLLRPFYWDKTQHGIDEEPALTPAS